MTHEGMNLQRPRSAGIFADFVFLFAVFAVDNFRYLFTRATLPAPPGWGITELLTQTVGNYQFTAQQWMQGEVPLWNPYSMLGIPHMALGITGTFYPPNLLYALEPFWLVSKIDVMAHLFMGCAFAYWLGRDITRSRVAGILVGLLFLFTPPTRYIYYAGHLSLVHTIVYAPLMLLLLRRLLDTAKPRYLVAFSATLTLQIFAGHSQLVVLELLGLGVFTIVELARRGIAEREAPFALFKKGTLAFLAVLLGAGMAGLQLVPSFELLQLSPRRTGGTYEFFSYGSLNPANLWHTLLWTPAKARPEHAPFFVWIGPFSIALAAYALLKRGSSEKWSFAGLAAFALIFAMGSTFEWWRIVYQLPILGSSREPFRILFLFALALGVLAGLGAVRLMKEIHENTLTIYSKSLISTLMALFVLPPLFSGNIGPGLVVALFLTAILLAAVWHNRRLPYGLLAVLLVACGTFEAWRMGHEYPPPYGAPEGFEYEEDFLQIAERYEGHDRFALLPGSGGLRRFQLAQQLGMIARERVLGGWAVLFPYRFELVTRELLGKGLVHRSEDGLFEEMIPYIPHHSDWVTAENLKFARMLNIRYYVTTRKRIALLETLAAKGGSVDKDIMENVVVYRDRGAMPPAYILHEARIADSPEDAFAMVKAPGFDIRKTVVVEADFDPSELKPAVREEGTRITEYRSGIVDLDIQVAAPGVLVLTDMFYPGWRATIDGEREAQIFGVNGAMRGIRVEPGDERVRFEYRPGSFRTGVFVSLFSLVWLIMIAQVATRSDGAPPTQNIG